MNCADTSGAFSCKRTGYYVTRKYYLFYSVAYMWEWNFRCRFTHKELNWYQGLGTLSGVIGALSNVKNAVIRAFASGPWGIAITVMGVAIGVAAAILYNANCTQNKGAYIYFYFRVAYGIPGYRVSGKCVK